MNIVKNGKPKPLQASTNIIHTKIPRRIENLIHDKAAQLPVKQQSDPLRKKQASTTKKQLDLKLSHQTPKIGENNVQQSHRSTIRKVDENDVKTMVENAYDPLKDVHPFDEELYQKVKKLELADDGLPEFDYSESFDF